MNDQNLIFIISQPRSGSTYLQSLLSNNLQINTSSESWMMLRLSPLLKPSTVKKADYDHAMATDAFNDYCAKFKINQLQQLKKFAFAHYSPMLEGFSLIIDKTPRYWEILDELYALFPKARYILLQRNPVDVVESMIKAWNLKTLNDLQYLARDLLFAPQQITNFINQHKDQKNILSLSYQDLIKNTEKITGDLYKWVGVPFQKAFLNISNNLKVCGKYGDPYLNGQEKRNQQIAPHFQDFIQGYAHSLGSEYLQNFGLTTENFSRTKDFEDFKKTFIKQRSLIRCRSNT